MSTATKNEVVVERVIKASPERIFRALTDGAELEKWFFSECRTDPRQGGKYRFKWQAQDDPSRDHDRFGQYLEFVPNERIAFEWLGDPGGRFPLFAEARTVVTITLKKEGDATRVRLVHTGWPETEQARSTRDSHQRGWTFYIENLDRYLGGGADLRVQEHRQRVKG